MPILQDLGLIGSFFVWRWMSGILSGTFLLVFFRLAFMFVPVIIIREVSSFMSTCGPT
jgi:hypothetical protein